MRVYSTPDPLARSECHRLGERAAVLAVCRTSPQHRSHVQSSGHWLTNLFTRVASAAQSSDVLVVTKPFMLSCHLHYDIYRYQRDEIEGSNNVS